MVLRPMTCNDWCISCQITLFIRKKLRTGKEPGGSSGDAERDTGCVQGDALAGERCSTGEGACRPDVRIDGRA